MAYKFNPFTGKLEEYGPILTGTGTVAAAADGTAALPGIAFANDLSVGIYRPGPEQLALSTNGTGRLFVDASGRVGVGGSPSTALHLGGSSSQTIRINSNTSAGFVGTIGYITQIAANRNPIDGSIVNTGTATAFINLEADVSNSSIQFCTTGTNNAPALERMRITSAGLVGIGTSSPTGLLTVAATSPAIDWTFASNTAFKHSIEATGYASSPISGNSLALKVANGSGTQATVMHLNGAGQVGIGTTSPLFPLDVNGVIYTRGRGSTFGVLFDDWRIYNSTAPGALVFDNGSERARIDSSGRLLVGTSSDSGGALLQVNGNRIRVATAKTPSSASDTGTAGEICWDADYIYVCTATNTWKRTAISTWP